MIGDLLNRVFTSKVFYIAFSLLVAFSLWLFIEIAHAHEDTITLDVPVQIVGEDILRSRDLFISGFSPEYVTLTFDASRTGAAALSRGPLVVEIDVSRITASGMTSIEHEIIYPDGFDQRQATLASRSVSRITLNIDRLISKRILVEAPYLGGTASDDLMVDPVIIDPPEIIVSGPEEVLSRISVAFVEILMENLTTTYIEDLPFILLDENGEPLDLELYEQLFFRDETVRVTVPVRMIREIPLTVDFFHGAGTTNENLNVTIEPATIILVGDPDAFKDLTHIVLGTIDTTLFGLRTLNPITYSIMLPPGNLENVSGILQAIIDVETVGLMTDSFVVSNISVINVPPGHDVEVLNERMVVRVRGTREDVEALGEQIVAGGLNIRIIVDLDGLDAGTHRISPPDVEIDISGFDRSAVAAVGAVAEYIVTVRLTPFTN